LKQREKERELKDKKKSDSERETYSRKEIRCEEKMVEMAEGEGKSREWSLGQSCSALSLTVPSVENRNT